MSSTTKEYKELSATGKSHALRTIIVLALIALIVGGAVWRIRSNNRAQAEQATRSRAAADRPIPVLVATVQIKTMPIYLTALGTVTAYNTVTIKTRVDGQLMQVNFTEGQKVKQGDLLLKIDPSPYEAALAQAEGQLAKDQAAAELGRAEAQRYNSLYQAGVVSRESAQTQESTFGQAAGAVKADEAAIQAAKVNLAYTRITSPIDGVVGLRLVDRGNIVHAADTTGLVLVTQLQPIAVVFTLPEDLLPQVVQRLHNGEKLVVDAYDRSEETHLATGSLLTLDNQIDTTTGTDKLKAVFPNKDDLLFPNQFVNVRLVLEQRKNVIVLPAAALQNGNQGTFVYVVGEDNKVVVRPIKTTITEGSQMLVDSGLQPGEIVVVDGQEKLRAGSSVVPSTSYGNVLAAPAAAQAEQPAEEKTDKHHHHADQGTAP
jgi:multidrug efflux system membrane fusion protein